MLNSPIKYALWALSTFYPPQKPLVFSGPNTVTKLAEVLIANGQTRPLVVTDAFLLKNGMLNELLSFFEAEGCKAIVFDNIIPNPTFAVVEAGLKVSLENNCDSVFVLGGGSAIDTAKVIAAASTNKRGLKKLAGILKVKEQPLPFYVVPTTSGSGSEVTTAAVISDTKTHKKTFFVDPKYIPIATALDPILLKSLPASMTAAVGMDALTHAIEAYASQNRFNDTDRDAEMAITLLFKYLPRAYVDGKDLKAREMVALASFLAGYAFTKSSLGYVHAISHQVSAHYNTPHGLANAVILPRVLRFNKQSSAKRFTLLEQMLSGSTESQDTTLLANRFIARVDDLAEKLDIPTNLPELNTKDFFSISKAALAEARSSYAVPQTMRKKHVEKILQSVATGTRDVSFA